ncbi:MAG: NFACT RNA binding domain-containing protein [Pyrinomonadaceae bacterium]
MDGQTISEIVKEIEPLLRGHSPGKIFQLSAFALAVDFHSRDKSYLFISADPNQPSLYMMARRVNELENQSLGLSPFAQALKSELSSTRIQSVKKDSDDRIVRLSFAGRDEVGGEVARTLIAQLTGRAANLFLLDDQDTILRALRTGRGDGQAVGQKYKSPAHSSAEVARAPVQALNRGAFKTLSEAADAHYRQLAETRAFTDKAATARTKLRKQNSQRQKLLRQLEGDLSSQSAAAEHKRIGDLLLANLSTAKRRGAVVQLIDYFADGAPGIEVEVDEASSLQEEAARRFGRYAKSKRAAQEITKRLGSVKSELEKLQSQQITLEQIISAGDEAALDAFTGRSPPSVGGKVSKKKTDKKIPGVRRYLSPDGYEILVGRAARDNDHLTFKVAKPYDLWLHAADYPGSHVIVRNPTRKEFPHSTIIAAAQLAAHFCQARKDSKVDVHYALRKFLSKPKGAAPGLVRMSSFKTITVEPAESIARL